MRYLFFLLFSLTLVSMSCEKDGDANALQGRWQLTQVIDKSPSTTLQAPPGLILSFNNTQFSGNTLRNAFGGDYVLTGTAGIAFNNTIATQVVEDSWGSIMFTVLNACMLQSIAPCLPSNYLIQGNTLKIFTPLRYDIVLERM